MSEIINLTGNNLNSFIVDIIDCIFKESTWHFYTMTLFINKDAVFVPNLVKGREKDQFVQREKGRIDHKYHIVYLSFYYE